MLGLRLSISSSQEIYKKIASSKIEIDEDLMNTIRKVSYIDMILVGVIKILDQNMSLAHVYLNCS